MMFSRRHSIITEEQILIKIYISIGAIGGIGGLYFVFLVETTNKKDRK